MRKKKFAFKVCSMASKLCIALVALVILNFFYTATNNKRQTLFTIFLDIPKNRSCKGISFPVKCSDSGVWLDIDSSKSMHMFSAYYVKSRKRVFVIGTKPAGRIDIICQLWFRSSDKKYISLRETRTETRVPDILPNRYVSTIFECPLKSTEMPVYVSFVQESCSTTTSVLCVNNASPPHHTYKRRFTVCLSPLYNDVNPYHLVEWIELNRILGAEQFMIYNYSVSNSIDPVLNYYANLDLVEIIQWQLPFQVKEIYSHGQTAALNDCLFRNKNISAFIVNTDMDEFIIPHVNNVTSWNQMIELFNNDVDVYAFRNTFFLNEQEADIPYNFVTFNRTLRNAYILPVKDLSKLITRTANVYWTQVHMVPYSKNFTVPTELGLLHHYRSRARAAKDRVIDTTVSNKYKDILLSHITSVLAKILD